MTDGEAGEAPAGAPANFERLLDQTRQLHARVQRLVAVLALSEEVVADAYQRLAGKGGANAEGNALCSQRARASADECRKFGVRLHELRPHGDSPPAAGPASLLRVVICDDRRLLRESLGRYLANQARIGQVELVADGDAAVRAVRDDADVLLLSVGHAGHTDGFEVLEALVNRKSRASVLVLGAAYAVEPAVKALSKGAVGVLRDDGRPVDLYEAILRAASGQVVLPEDLVGPVLRQVSVDRRQRQENQRVLANLTDRERAVLQLLSNGVNRREIADRLGVSENTVRTHIAHVMRKLGVHSQLAAAVKGRTLLAGRYGPVVPAGDDGSA